MCLYMKKKTAPRQVIRKIRVQNTFKKITKNRERIKAATHIEMRPPRMRQSCRSFLDFVGLRRSLIRFRESSTSEKSI